MRKKAFILDEKSIALFLEKSNYNILTFLNFLYGRQWNLREIKKFWEKHIQEIKKKNLAQRISFYIHIPFCLSKCEYCRHFYWQLKREEELDYYLKSLIFKMNFFRNVFSGIKFKTLYIGGGTPSLLSEKQLKTLFVALYKNFKFEENGEKTLECNPITVTFKKLKILEQFGINRISFGVQSTNEKILKSMNRGYQSFDLVKRVINNAKKCNFKRINVDLMIGLYRDSAKTVIKGFQEVAELRPDSIALYPLQPTPDYLEKYYQGKKYLFARELKKKIKTFFNLIGPAVSKYNYFYFFSFSEPLALPVDSWNFVSKEYIENSKKHFSYIYDDTEKIDCFGLGIESFSYIFGNLRYQEIDRDFYQMGNFNSNQKICHGIKFVNLKEQKLYYLLAGLDSNKLSLQAYKKLFRSDLLEDFQAPINKLKRLNKIRISRGLVFLRSKSPHQRFIDSLFFFDKELINKKITSLIKNEKSRY